MPGTQSTSKTPPPSPPTRNSLSRSSSTRLASTRLHRVLNPNPIKPDAIIQPSQDPCWENTQHSNWSDDLDSNSDLDSASVPLARKAKLTHIPNSPSTPEIDIEKIDYGNLPLIDIWEAKVKRWTQEEVERLPGFNKPNSPCYSNYKPREKERGSKQEEEVENDEVPTSHVLCDGGAGRQIHIDPDELLACSLAPLPDDDEDEEGDLAPATEKEQDHVIWGDALEHVAAVWAGEHVAGVYVCVSQPLPDSDDEKL